MQDPDPKSTEKQDPDPDPKKIITETQKNPTENSQEGGAL